MLEKPRLINILRNDSWAATNIASVVFMAAITAIVQIVNWVTGMELSNVDDYLMITGVTTAVAAVFIPLRVRHVMGVFENGMEVRAMVVSKRIHKTNLKLNLRYKVNGADWEKTLDQVITEHTKHFLEDQEVLLVVDQYNPGRILLRDAYF